MPKNSKVFLYIFISSLSTAEYCNQPLWHSSIKDLLYKIILNINTLQVGWLEIKKISCYSHKCLIYLSCIDYNKLQKSTLSNCTHQNNNNYICIYE